MKKDHKHVEYLWNRLKKGIYDKIPSVDLNGSLDPNKAFYGNLNVSFAYVEGESLMMKLNDLSMSSGSACTSGTLEPSYVLRALNVSEELAHTSIRFGSGRFTTEKEIDYVLKRLEEVIFGLREMSPLWEMA